MLSILFSENVSVVNKRFPGNWFGTATVSLYQKEKDIKSLKKTCNIIC